MDRETAEPRVDTIPGERARRWVEYHRSHAPPSTYVYDFVWDVTADAEGPFCTDVDGNVLMDFTSHVAASPLGYNNPKVMERLEAFDPVSPLKIAGHDFYLGTGNVPEDPDFPGPSALMDRLVEKSSQYGMNEVFLSNSGAEAVENAIKICYDHRRGKHAVTFEGGFHGRTLGALSLNRSKAVHRKAFPELSGVSDVPFCDDRSCDRSTCDCGFFVDDGDTSRLRRKLATGGGSVEPSEVSYVVVEPIQGEGGYRVPSDDFLSEVGDVCTEHDIPLVVDEVQSGIGRTGTFWASEQYDVEPDVIASAKALRVGATIANEDVFPDEKGRLSSTWGAGDLLNSLQGAVTIDVVDEYDLLDNAVEKGRRFKDSMTEAAPAHVEDVRGRGLMLGVEFDSQQRRDDVMTAAFGRGLLTIGCGHRTLRVLPPLDVTEPELDLGTEILLDAIGDVADAA